MNGGGAPLLRILHSVIVIALGGLGLGSLHAGVVQRADAEPPGLVAGPGLLPGVEQPGDTEIRASVVALPSPAIRKRGSGLRRLGSALMAAALAVAVLCRPGGSRSGTVIRAAFGALGGASLWLCVSRASAAVPTGTQALDGLLGAAPFFALSLLLILAWRS